VKRLIAGAATATFVIGAAIGILAGPVSADPVNAKKGEILEIECDSGLGTLTVALNGNGDFTPGHVTTSTQVGIPYKAHFEFTFTPTGGTPQTETEDIAKKGPRNGRLAVCTFHEEGSDEEGAFAIDGTVWISYTPAH
jgi:hypothetical protein